MLLVLLLLLLLVLLLLLLLLLLLVDRVGTRSLTRRRSWCDHQSVELVVTRCHLRCWRQRKPARSRTCLQEKKISLRCTDWLRQVSSTVSKCLRSVGVAHTVSISVGKMKKMT